MNLNHPIVTVVLPFYNRIHTIEGSLTSVINQTFINWELLIVDDGSSEEESKNLTELVIQLKDPRIQVLIQNKNLGGGAARNIGMLAAKGEYIALLDSDDEWESEKLERQVAFHQGKSKNLVTYTKSLIHYGVNKKPQAPLPLHAIEKDEKISDYLFVKGGFIQTSALFGYRSVFINSLFDTKLRRHQDYDFLLSLELAGCTFNMINEVLVHIHWEDVGTKAGDRFYCPDVSAQFISDRSELFSVQAAAAFRLNNVFAPLRRKEGLRKALYNGFWSDLIRVKLWRVRLMTISLLCFRSTLPLSLPFRLFKLLK